MVTSLLITEKTIYIDKSGDIEIHIGKNDLYGFFHFNKIENVINFTIRSYIDFFLIG